MVYMRASAITLKSEVNFKGLTNGAFLLSNPDFDVKGVHYYITNALDKDSVRK